MYINFCLKIWSLSLGRGPRRMAGPVREPGPMLRDYATFLRYACVLSCTHLQNRITRIRQNCQTTSVQTPKKEKEKKRNSLMADGWCVSVCHCPLSCLFFLFIYLFILIGNI